jgi:hypothetical protein
VSAGGPQAIAAKHRLDRAVAAYLVAMMAAKKYVATGHDFLQTVEHLDQRLVVDAIVEQLSIVFRVDPDELRTAVWRDLKFPFGWRGDIADLEPAGAA